MKYRMRTNEEIIVHAMRLEEDNVDTIANWTQAQIVTEKDALTGEPQEGLNLYTADGKVRCSRGMYVIKYGDDFLVSAGGKFETMYEPLP